MGVKHKKNVPNGNQYLFVIYLQDLEKLIFPISEKIIRNENQCTQQLKGLDTTHSKRKPAHRFECNHRGSLGNQLRFRTVLYSTRVSSLDNNKYFTILFLCTRNSSSRRENKTNKQKHHIHCPHRAQMVVEKKDNKVKISSILNNGKCTHTSFPEVSE